MTTCVASVCAVSRCVARKAAAVRFSFSVARLRSTSAAARASRSVASARNADCVARSARPHCRVATAARLAKTPSKTKAATRTRRRRHESARADSWTKAPIGLLASMPQRFTKSTPSARFNPCSSARRFSPASTASIDRRIRDSIRLRVSRSRRSMSICARARGQFSISASCATRISVPRSEVAATSSRACCETKVVMSRASGPPSANCSSWAAREVTAVPCADVVTSARSTRGKA